MTIVNVGTTANDGTGDTLRQALILINQEFAQYAGQGFLSVKYIGAAASNPTARLDAAALQQGDFYLHTPSTTFRFYNGSAWVEAADLEAVNQVLAECEMARDTAYGTARLYANTAAALADAALLVGQYFAVVSSDNAEVAIVYLKAAGPVATDTGKRVPAADLVLKPSWAGKRNGWPDPFFRETGYLASNTILNAIRWWNAPGDYANWARVANTVFDGFMLTKTGNANLSGPVIRLADLGLVAGDKITVRMLVTGAGATVGHYGRFALDNGTWVGGQVYGVTDTGSFGLVTSATPQLMTLEETVPATATELRLYPVATAPGVSFNVVALWAFKGVKTAGPRWPILLDQDALKHKVDLNTATVASQGTRLTATEAAITYAVDSFGAVTASAETVALAVTSPSTAGRDLTFRGWGEPYVPAGVSFNAVRIKTITRIATLESSKWRTLHIMVRTGAGSHLGTAPVVAVGSTTVVKNSDTLSNVTILLKDPVTGAPKTLTDADFTGGEYFIGVYASNDVGAPASCGEPRGTLPNHLGSIGYYTTAASPLTANWSAVTGGGGWRQGFEHLLLTNPVEGVQYAPGTVMLADILAAAAATSPAPELVLPPTIYGVQGREGNVYLDNITPAAVADQFAWDVAQSGDLGKHEQTRYTLTPAGAITSGTVTFSAHDRRTGTLLASATAQLRAAASTAGSGTTKKVLVVGDSLVNAGVITQTLLDVAAGDVMGITLLGTRGSGANKHEGRGGWTVTGYTTNYSDGVVGANPFWIGGAVNVPQYLADNTINIPDWFFVALGINDIFGQTTDANAVLTAGNQFTALDTLIASMKAAGASVKVALVIPSPPTASQDAFGNDYGVGQTRWRFKRNILIWAREMITRYGGQEASRIYLVPSNLALDTANNMVTTSGVINSRNAATVARQSNSVHPATSGYQQIGDAWWAFLKANA